MKKCDLIKKILKQELPLCFKSGDEKQPLKVGISLPFHFHYKDDPRFEPQHLQRALNSYTCTRTYLSKIIEGNVRIDLHGNPAGFVTAEDEAFAKNRLKMLDAQLELAANLQKA